LRKTRIGSSTVVTTYFPFRPLVKNGWVEIGSVRPHERVCLWIKSDLVEQGGVLKSAVQLALQDWSKVNHLGRAVGKLHP